MIRVLFYYICPMSIQEVIETISSVLRILSFLGFDVSITSLFKKTFLIAYFAI